MAKSELDYTVSNNLDSLINIEIGKRMSANGGIKVLKGDIISEVSTYCGISWEGINRIKRGLSLPSLPVAMKIAKYFNKNVEDVFKLEDD